MKSPNKRRDLRLIFHGDAIWSQSGYAVELDWLIRRLLKDGWQVAQASKAGLHGHWIDYKMDEGTLRMYPAIDDPHGSDTLFYGAKHFGAHVAISMIDTWVITQNWLQQLKQLGCRWIPWLPIDSSPVTPGVLRNLPLADKIITFSKFGQKELARAGFASQMIYEGIDMEFLKPRDKMVTRAKLGFPPDIFLWGMISANKENPPRKGYQEALEAFKMFVEVHPEARLFFHTQQISGASFPIREYAQYLGIGNQTLFFDQVTASIFASRDDVVDQYSCFDAYLSPSQTEGFGLTIVEAQAMGVPVVITDAHSMPELIIEGKTGAKCRVGSRWFTNALSFWERPDPRSIYEAMEKVYEMVKKDQKQVAFDCRKQVNENFNIDKIFEKEWTPFFEKLQDELLPSKI